MGKCTTVLSGAEFDYVKFVYTVQLKRHSFSFSSTQATTPTNWEFLWSPVQFYHPSVCLLPGKTDLWKRYIPEKDENYFMLRS